MHVHEPSEQDAGVPIALLVPCNWPRDGRDLFVFSSSPKTLVRIKISINYVTLMLEGKLGF